MQRFTMCANTSNSVYTRDFRVDFRLVIVASVVRESETSLQIYLIGMGG